MAARGAQFLHSQAPGGILSPAPPDLGLAFSSLHPTVALPTLWLTAPSWACRLLPRPLLKTDSSSEPPRFFYLRAFLVEGEIRPGPSSRPAPWRLFVPL